MSDLSAPYRKIKRLLRINRFIQRLFRIKPTAEGFRANMAKLMKGDPPEGVRRVDVSAGGVPAAWFVPEQADTTKAIVHFHGGGYVAGSIETHREYAGHLAQETGIPVLVPDYRLAPEHPFPAALDDALAVLRWLRENGLEGAAAPLSVRIGGDSAGGGLSLSVMMALKQTGEPLPDCAVLISPWTDLTGGSATVKSRAKADLLLGQPMLDIGAAAYAGEAAKLDDPRVSPLMGDFSGLPPLYIIVGDAEILLDDSRLAAEKAKAAGVDVTLDVWDDMLHIWPVLWPRLPEGRQMLLKIADFIKG